MKMYGLRPQPITPNHDVAVRADFTAEIQGLCDDHLMGDWGFQRVDAVQHGNCKRCEEMLWEHSGFSSDDDLTVGECGVFRYRDGDWHAGCAPQERDPDYR